MNKYEEIWKELKGFHWSYSSIKIKIDLNND